MKILPMVLLPAAVKAFIKVEVGKFLAFVVSRDTLEKY